MSRAGYYDQTDAAWVSRIWRQGSAGIKKTPEEQLRDELRSWGVALDIILSGFRVTTSQHTLMPTCNICLNCDASTPEQLRSDCESPGAFLRRSLGVISTR